MEYKIVVWTNSGIVDALGETTKRDIIDLGIKGIKSVQSGHLYLIKGNISLSQTRKIAAQLFSDPVIQNYEIESSKEKRKKEKGVWKVEVCFKEGVTDNVGETGKKGIKDLGIEEIEEVRTGRQYLLYGKISSKEVQNICQRLLANDLIQTYKVVHQW